MKIQTVLAIVLLTILSLIYCDLKKPNTPQFGGLTISLIFPEDPGLRLKKATITIDRVHINIINSSNQTIISNDLAKSGSVFTGDFEVPIGSGYKVEADCYQSSALIFQGIDTNKSVQAGKTTPADITLTSTVQTVTIFPSSITLLPNGTEQFNAYAFFPPHGDSIDVTSEASWSVSPSNAGSFSSPGLFKASNNYIGNDTIYASYYSKQGTAVNNTPNSIELIVSPESWDYGTVKVGQSSDKSFTITNSPSSTAILSVTNQSIIGTNASEFSIVNGGGSFSLAPGQSHTTTLRFSPQTSGPKSATFRINNNSDNAPTKEVPLVGVGSNIIIEVTPESWDYGTVKVGQSSDKPFTITNSSSSTATLNVTNQGITGTNASEFSVMSGGGTFSLSPGQSHTTTIRFSPQTSGTKSATFRIENNSDNAPVKDVYLTGAGEGTITIEVSPESWDYDTVKVGQSSDKTFTIKNSSSSTATLNVTNQSTIGTNASEFLIISGGGSFSLAVGQSHTTTIRFSPQTSGTKSATFRIENNSDNAPTKDVSLNGQGDGHITIEVNPESWNYGTVKVGQSADKAFTITNSSSSTATLNVTHQSITGTNVSEFPIVNGSGSFSLAPGQSHTTTIRFSPKTSGPKSATFRINNNSDNAPAKDVYLTGTGEGTITIEVSPESWDYDTVNVRQSLDKSFTIKNASSSTGNLSVNNQSIIGINASEFSIVSGSGFFSLAPGQAHTTTIRFSPQSSGTKNATFRINNDSDNAPTKDVPLSGSGFEFEMIYIPAGDFTMGSNEGAPDEKPVHSAYLDAYYVDKYEVTNYQYAAYLNAVLAVGEIQVFDKTVYKNENPLLYMYAEITYNGIQFIVDHGKEYYPVVKVTWYGASAYAEHFGKRLPTEAEWEKAARGTDQRKYPWGSNEPTPLQCNYNLNYTTRVGQYSPSGDSPYGCSDIAGNVREWCSDWYNRDYYSNSPYSNPKGPSTGDSRIDRGGCWGSNEYSIRCAIRYDASPQNGDGWTGFRCVR